MDTSSPRDKMIVLPTVDTLDTTSFRSVTLSRVSGRSGITLSQPGNVPSISLDEYTTLSLSTEMMRSLILYLAEPLILLISLTAFDGMIIGGTGLPSTVSDTSL